MEGKLPFGKFSSCGPSSVLLCFLTTLKPGPSLCFLGVDGNKAFSYSEISWNEGFGRVSLLSSKFNRPNCSCSSARPGERVPLSSDAAPGPADAARSSRGETRASAEGSWFARKPYWEASTRSDELVKVGAGVESSVGSGCIKLRGEEWMLKE